MRRKFPWLEKLLSFAESCNPAMNFLEDSLDIDYLTNVYMYQKSKFNRIIDKFKPKYLYKNIDFENECLLEEPIKIPIDSINFEQFIKYRTIPIFNQECLSITDLATIPN